MLAQCNAAFGVTVGGVAPFRDWSLKVYKEVLWSVQFLVLLSISYPGNGTGALFHFFNLCFSNIIHIRITQKV